MVGHLTGKESDPDSKLLACANRYVKFLSKFSPSKSFLYVNRSFHFDFVVLTFQNKLNNRTFVSPFCHHILTSLNNVYITIQIIIHRRSQTTIPYYKYETAQEKQNMPAIHSYLASKVDTNRPYIMHMHKNV